MMHPITNQSEFVEFARAAYDNPACVSFSEFETDLKRFSQFNRLVEKDSNSRLLINSVIILYNLFGDRTYFLAEYKMNEKSFYIFCSISVLLQKMIGEIPQEHEWIKEGIQ